jgi:hypothetical protein
MSIYMLFSHGGDLHKTQDSVTMYVPRRRIISFCVGFGLVIGLPFLAACQRGLTNMPKEVATLEAPAVSPSGKYTLVVIPDKDGQLNVQYFQIQNNQDKEILYSSPDQFAVRHTTYFLWDKDERVWVYSGDVGTFFWEQNSETKEWQKHGYAQSNVPAPEFLKKMRPQFFKK